MTNLFTFALKPAISCILLYFNLAHVNFDLIGRQSNDLRYIWLAAKVLIRIAQLRLCTLRWQRIVHRCDTPDDPPFTISNAFRYIFIAAFFNQTLPSTVGGDASHGPQPG